MTEVLKHPFFSALSAACVCLLVLLGVSGLQVRGLKNDLRVAQAEASAARDKLENLATASAAREASAKAAAATALSLAKNLQAHAAQITATPLPAGADHCAAASALITQETK